MTEPRRATAGLFSFALLAVCVAAFAKVVGWADGAHDPVPCDSATSASATHGSDGITSGVGATVRWYPPGCEHR